MAERCGAVVRLKLYRYKTVNPFPSHRQKRTHAVLQELMHLKGGIDALNVQANAN